jgi:cytochrome c553
MRNVLIIFLFFETTNMLFANGETLYKKFCAECHGKKGEKRALNKSAIIKNFDSAIIEADLKGYKAGTIDKQGMGILMKGQVAHLSDADIKALAEYIGRLK